MTFAELLAALAAPSDARMSEPWTWPGHSGETLQVRDAHWRCVEAEQGVLAAAAPAPAESAAVLGLAQAAWGDLRGLVAGLPDGVLDASPGNGEWTLRQVLAHTLLTERRYRVQTGHAARRADDEPVRAPVPEALEAGEDTGGPRRWIERMDAERALTDGELGSLAPPALLRPTIWAGHPVDVRFRLHRCAAHIAEHAIQAEKVLHALGAPPGEARQAVRRLSALRGAHERRTPATTLASLDARHAALVATLAGPLTR